MNMSERSCLQHVWERSDVDTGFVFLSCGLIIVNLITILGNGMVVLAVVTYRRLRTVNAYLITSLAFADLSVGLLVLPFSIANEATSHWIFGHVWCQVWLAVDVWLCTASIFNLVVISFDRYAAITNPLKYPSILTTSRCRLLIVLVWTSSFLVSFPPMVSWPSKLDDGNQLNLTFIPANSQTAPDLSIICQCTPMNNSSGYIFFSAICSFHVPMVLIMFMYVRIYLVVRNVTRGMTNGELRLDKRRSCYSPDEKNNLLTVNKSNEGLRIHRGGGGQKIAIPPIKCRPGRANSMPNNVMQGCAIHSYSRSSLLGEMTKLELTAISSEEASSHSVAQRVIPVITKRRPTKNKFKKHRFILTHKSSYHKRIASEMHALKSVAVVTGCFIICWIGFAICYTIQGMPFCKQCIPQVLFSVVFWLGYCNSSFNPIIYAAFNGEFRTAFRRLLHATTRRARYTRTEDSTFAASRINASYAGSYARYS